MGNMSYCRFENTEQDLADCEEALEELLHGEPHSELSRQYELPAAKCLVKKCQRIVEMIAEQVNKEVEDLTENDVNDVLNAANEHAEANTKRERG